MSRRYAMFTTISDFSKDKQKDIEEAASRDVEFDDWFYCEQNGTLTSGGEVSLSAGMTDGGMAQIITEAVWKANRGFCRVTVNSTYLDDLPYETFEHDQDDYDMFVEMGDDPEEEECD